MSEINREEVERQIKVDGPGCYDPRFTSTETTYGVPEPVWIYGGLRTERWTVPCPGGFDLGMDIVFREDDSVMGVEFEVIGARDGQVAAVETEALPFVIKLLTKAYDGRQK